MGSWTFRKLNAIRRQCYFIFTFSVSTLQKKKNKYMLTKNFFSKKINFNKIILQKWFRE